MSGPELQRRLVLRSQPRSDFREPGAFGRKDLVNGFREQTVPLRPDPAARTGEGLVARRGRPTVVFVLILAVPRVRIDRGLEFAAGAVRDAFAALSIDPRRLPAFCPCTGTYWPGWAGVGVCAVVGW
jgi:hypothetical protein